MMSSDVSCNCLLQEIIMKRRNITLSALSVESRKQLFHHFLKFINKLRLSHIVFLLSSSATINAGICFNLKYMSKIQPNFLIEDDGNTYHQSNPLELNRNTL